MKRSLFALALGVLAIATMPAQAAKIWIEPHGCSVEDCHAIHIDGKIQEEDFKKFEGIVAAKKIKNAVVHLDSIGGNMMASVQMGLKINSLGFGTYVADNTRCESGCAMIWLAGKPRYSAPTAMIGFHQAYLKDRRGRIQRFPQGNAIVRDYYAKLGISKPATDFLLSADPKDMYWLNDDLAKGFGIEIASFPAAPKKEPVSAGGVVGAAIKSEKLL